MENSLLEEFRIECELWAVKNKKKECELRGLMIDVRALALKNANAIFKAFLTF